MSNILKEKLIFKFGPFTGTAEYVEDEGWLGEIEPVSGCVHYWGDTRTELYNDFMDAIEVYLEVMYDMDGEEFYMGR